jgi:hypothetical protein
VRVHAHQPKLLAVLIQVHGSVSSQAMEQRANGTLADRYGTSRRRPGRAPVVVVGVLVVAALVWALWAGLHHSRAEVSWQVTSFQTHDSDVVISFTLHRRGSFAATCTFRARGRDGAQVGRGSLDIPVSRRDSVSSVYTLATSAPPVTGEIETCVRAGAK